MIVAPGIAVVVVRTEEGTHATISLQLQRDATVEDALRAAAAELGIEDIESLREQVGVFGQRCAFDVKLHDSDRIEIYRPLLLDPKAARRLRAERAARRARQK